EIVAFTLYAEFGMSPGDVEIQFRAITSMPPVTGCGPDTSTAITCPCFAVTPMCASSATFVAPLAGRNVTAFCNAARCSAIVGPFGWPLSLFACVDERAAPATVTAMPAQSTATRTTASTPPDHQWRNFRRTGGPRSVRHPRYGLRRALSTSGRKNGG